jgi:CHC2-type zinc finger protein
MNTTPSRLDMSACPPMLSFLQQHFDRVPRPSCGRVMMRCNFPDHPDRTPSMCWNLATGKFRCYGCGRHGDAIDYLTIRYGMDFKQAARSLGVWRDEITKDQSRELRRLQNQRERQRAKEAARKEQERQQQIAARDQLHRLENDYSQASVRLSRLRRGAPERYRGEEGLAWWFLSDALPRIREAEFTYRRLAGLEQA